MCQKPYKDLINKEKALIYKTFEIILVENKGMKIKVFFSNENKGNIRFWSCFWSCL